MEIEVEILLQHTDVGLCRVVEQEIESAIDSRNDALPTLRELGPPDLVHLVKQSVKSGSRQVRNVHSIHIFTYTDLTIIKTGVYHHVTGIDASSSASLAAYINTLTQTSQDRSSKVTSGLYWFVLLNYLTSVNEIDTPVKLLQCFFAIRYACRG